MKKDWLPYRIKARIERSGLTLSQISLNAGLNRAACSAALRRRFPAAELAIANALGLKVQYIWPSRYTPDGKSRSTNQPTKFGRCAQLENNRVNSKVSESQKCSCESDIAKIA